MEILLTYANSDNPFISKKDNKYYINHIEYTDDIDLLLESIKNIKEITWDELHIKCDNKKDYWQAALNYSYTGSCIIYKSPTEMWEEELCRQGKLKCITCGAIMKMYYRVYCPLCTGLQKYEYYNYNELVNIIESKYNIDISTYQNSGPYFFEFMENNYFNEIQDNSLFTINWKEIYDDADEDWQKEIISYFLKEFGEEDYTVLIG